MHTTRGILLACVCLAGAVGIAMADTTLHISPQGDDTAPGTAATPVRTLEGLQALLAERADVTGIVFREGVYPGSLEIPLPPGVSAENAADLPPMLVRSAEGETAVLDGAVRLDDAEPMPGMPGVFVADGLRFRSEGDRQRGRMPAVWDAVARQRYRLVADLRAVARFPASYAFDRERLYVHTSDGRPPAELDIEVSRLDVAAHGLTVRRPNVTVRGLHARNYHLSNTGSAGFLLAADHGIIEDCVTFNSPRGFRIGRNVRHGTVRRSRSVDCACGVLANGTDAVIEDNVFIRTRDAFMMPMPLQEDTGIEIYHPAGGRYEVRGNVARGFTFCGIFIKCWPGAFVLERNTLVENTTGIGWSPSPGKHIVARDNIIYGGARGIQGQTSDQARVRLEASGNVIWPGPWADPRAVQAHVEELNQMGEGNEAVDPRMVAPEAHDFRLLPKSPVAGRGVGAAGAAPTDIRDTHPPRVDLSGQPALAPLEGAAGERAAFVSTRTVFPLRIRAHDAVSRPVQMRLRVGDAPWSEALPFAADHEVRLPRGEGLFDIEVRVADEAGNWSEPTAIVVQARAERPAFASDPLVRANAHGVVVSLDTNVECFAAGEFGPDPGRMRPLRRSGTVSARERGAASRTHALGALRPRDVDGAWHYRVWLETETGERMAERTGTFVFEGNGRTWSVSPEGQDGPDLGSAEAPWRTLQYAADRALPGDRVVLDPGLYEDGALIVRGGVADAPLRIEAREPGTVVLDGHREVRNLVHLVGAPHVTIDGLELRWYGDPYGVGIRVDASPEVTVRRCRIWNAFWHEGRATGTAILAVNSPGLTVDRSLIYRNDHAMRLSRSPGARLLNNTVRGQVHGGLYFDESVAGTVLRNNCLTYNGNYVFVLSVADPSEMDTFDSDYNNLGTRIRDWHGGPDAAPNLAGRRTKRLVLFTRKGGTWLLPTWREPLFPPANDLVIRNVEVPPPDSPLWEGRGELMRIWVPNETTPPERRGGRYWGPATFEDWKEFSGQDANSIFAEPDVVDVMDFDFRLSPGSPNIGAGKDGATIGALEAVERD